MKVLVTGGAGFIGSHVVDQLVHQGAGVVVLDSLSPAAHAVEPDYLNDGAHYLRADVTDAAAVSRSLSGIDAVVHLAARVGLETGLVDAPDYVSDNDLGTAVLLASMAAMTPRSGRSVPLVLASSMVVYGEGAYRCPEHGRVRPLSRSRQDLEAGIFDGACPQCRERVFPEDVEEDEALDPRNVYAATKVHQEHLCAAYGRQVGATVIALRYHNVYGPRMPRDTPYAGVASIFASSLARGEAPRVFEDGGQRRDFVHVRDVAAATVLAIEAALSGGSRALPAAYNIASGAPHTVGEMAVALCRASGNGVSPVVTGQYRIGDVRHIVASPRMAREVLGYRATIDFEGGMHEFVHAPQRVPVRDSAAQTP